MATSIKPRRRKSRQRAAATTPREARLRPVGVIRSALKERRLAPKQGFEGAPDAWLEIHPWAKPALLRMAAGDEILVLTWLHQARRNVFQVHPRSDPENRLTGVFATRSPDRPNPIGLHPVVVKAVKGRRLLVGPIEAIDATPVLDVKVLLQCERPLRAT